MSTVWYINNKSQAPLKLPDLPGLPTIPVGSYADLFANSTATEVKNATSIPKILNAGLATLSYRSGGAYVKGTYNQLLAYIATVPPVVTPPLTTITISDVVNLQSVLDTKATKSELNALENDLDDKANLSDVEGLQANINAKADLTTVTALSLTVDSKASLTTVSALEATVATKANASALTALEAEVALKAYIADVPDVTALTAAIASKAESSALTSHTSNTSNPHSVTKTQIGLANVTNDAQLKVSSNLSDVANAATARTNLGLGSIATYDPSSFDPAGSASTVQGNLNTHTSNTSNPHSVTKSQVGLSNVTNDAQLPLSGGTMTGALVLRTLSSLGDSGTDGEIAVYGNTAFLRKSSNWLRLSRIFTGTVF